MPIASQIKSLAEDIEASYGARIVAVSDIVKETHQSLGSFHRAHKRMADELRDSLSTSERERLEEFAILIGDVKAAVKAIEKDTANTRVENVKELKEMAHKLAEFLSSSEKERLEEFAPLMRDIKAAVRAIEKDTAETLADFRSSHKEMSEAQRAELASSEKGRLEEFAILIRDVKAAVRAIEKDTAETRAENVKELKEMAQEVKEFLSEVANDLRQARTHWQNLARVMAAKRVGKPIPAARTEMGVSQAVKEEAEEAFETGELKERVLKVIQAHPGGITLPEIGKVLRIAYIRISRPIKDLLEEMVVTKRDSEYFPA